MNGWAHRRGTCWLGDALTACRELGLRDAVELRAVVELLVPEALPAAKPAEATPEVPIETYIASLSRATERETGLRAPSPQVTPSEIASHLVEVTRERLSRRRRAASLPLDDVEHWQSMPETLFEPPLVRSIVRELSCVDGATDHVDVDELVRNASRGRHLQRLPMRIEPTVRFGVDLLLDRSAGVDLFKADLESIRATVHAVLGGSLVRVLHFERVPEQAGVGPRRSWSFYRLPDVPRRALIITRLDDPGAVSAWTSFLRRRPDASERALALVPHAVELVSKELRRFLRVVEWDRGTTVSAVRRAKFAGSVGEVVEFGALSPEAERLARCLSCAAFIEPALMRAMRLEVTRRATVGDELAVGDWGRVTSRSHRGFTFEPSACEELRDELAMSADLEAALALVSRYHARAPFLLRMEERVVAGALRARSRPALERDLHKAIAAEIDGVLATMEGDPDRCRDLAAWAARTLSRFPREARAVSSAKVLSYVASARVPTSRYFASALTKREAARARPLLPDKAVAVYVRRVEDSVELVSRSQPGEGRWHSFSAPDTEPIVVRVKGRARTLRAGERTSVPVSSLWRAFVEITTADGRAWQLREGNPADAIARVIGGARPGYAWLIDHSLAVTTVEVVSGEVQLEFPHGIVNARSVGKSDRVTRATVLKLDVEMNVTPLAPGADPVEGGHYDLFVARSAGNDRWMRCLGGDFYPQDGLADVHPVEELDESDQGGLGGAVLMADGRVAGHVRNASDGRYLMCPSSFVESAVARTLEPPRRVIAACASLMPGYGPHAGESGTAVRICTGLLVSGRHASLDREAQARLDLGPAQLWFVRDDRASDPVAQVTGGFARQSRVGWVLVNDEREEGRIGDPVASVAFVTSTQPESVLVAGTSSSSAFESGNALVLGGALAGIIDERASNGDWMIVTLRQIMANARWMLSPAKPAMSGAPDDKHSPHRAYDVTEDEVQSMERWREIRDAIPALRLAQIALKRGALDRKVPDAPWARYSPREGWLLEQLREDKRDEWLDALERDLGREDPEVRFLIDWERNHPRRSA